MNRYLFLFFLCTTLFLVACGPDEAERVATIEHQVALAAAATLSVIPSTTPIATFTPQATYTPEPSPSSFPSTEPQATYTIQPTLTPEPTYTPPSTLTPTVTPVPIAQSSTPLANPPVATGFTFDAFYLDVVRNRMDRVVVYMFPRTAPFNRENPGLPRPTNYNVDCANMLTAYDFLKAGLITQPTDLTALEQAVFTNYQTAVTLFTNTLDDFVPTCHSYLANQQEGWRMNESEINLILTTMTEVKAILQDGINRLNSE